MITPSREPVALFLAEQLTPDSYPAPPHHTFQQEPDRHCWYRAEMAIATGEPRAIGKLGRTITRLGARLGLPDDPENPNILRLERLRFLEEATPLLQARAEGRAPSTDDWQASYRLSGRRLANSLKNWRGLSRARNQGRVGNIRGVVAERLGLLLTGGCYPASWREDREFPGHDGYRIENDQKIAVVDFKITDPYHPDPAKKPGVKVVQLGYLADHIIRDEPWYYGSLLGPDGLRAPRAMRLDQAFYALGQVTARNALGLDQHSDVEREFFGRARIQAGRLAVEPDLSLAALYPHLRHTD